MVGRLQVYTGDGKGKTTAAMGLALRAAGAGLRVFFGQFMKRGDDHGIALLKTFPQMQTAAFGDGAFICGAPTACQIEAARDGLRRTLDAASSGNYDLVVADEINVACTLKLLSEPALLTLLDCRAPSTELVLTGRDAPQSVLLRADLVTEMVCRKHYFDTEKLDARSGVEY